MMELYTYFRSSAAHRVRIALNLKGLDYKSIPVSLIKDGGEQHDPEYRALNPQGFVPSLVHKEFSLSQSLAMIEYLDELYPNPPLLPGNPERRARIRQISQIIACDVHPLNNLRVLRYLKTVLKIGNRQRVAWYHHWILDGFDALELWLTADAAAGPYCMGAEVTLADVCLIPQIDNARRLKVPMEDFPTLCEIENNCRALDAFQRASPVNQPDASSD